MWGHNLPNLVGFRLTNLPKSEGVGNHNPPLPPRILRSCSLLYTLKSGPKGNDLLHIAGNTRMYDAKNRA